MFKVSLSLSLIDKTTIRCETELVSLPRENEELFVRNVSGKSFCQLYGKVKFVKQIIEWDATEPQNHFFVLIEMIREVDMIIDTR